MAFRDVTLDTTSWTQVSADSATFASVLLPEVGDRTAGRAGGSDAVQVTVTAAAPADDATPAHLTLTRRFPGAMGIPIGSGEAVYARWIAPADIGDNEMFVVVADH